MWGSRPCERKSNRQAFRGTERKSPHTSASVGAGNATGRTRWVCLVKRARLVEDDVQDRGKLECEKLFDTPEKSQTIFSQEGMGWSFHIEKIIESCFWRQTGERPV